MDFGLILTGKSFLKSLSLFKQKNFKKPNQTNKKLTKTQGNFMTLEFLSEVSVKHRALSHHMNH